MAYENFNWITEQLAVGGLVSDPDELPFDAILSLETAAPATLRELVRGGAVDYRWQSIIDGYTWEQHDDIVGRFDDAALQIHEWIADGKRVLVHCAAGVSRSATAVVWYLMRYRGRTWDEALAMVRSARPQVCPNPRFEIALRVAAGERLDREALERGIEDHSIRLAEYGVIDSSREVWRDLERQGTAPLMEDSARVSR